MVFVWILLFLISLVASLTVWEGGLRTSLRHKYPLPGQLISAGAHRLHLHCQGEGKVTVILEDGMGHAGSLSWFKVQPAIATFTRVCSYDRAGLMWSEPSGKAPTVEQQVHDLHTALTNAQIEPPYVLVGTSMGGIYVRAFTHYYPDEVVGLVLVESAHPEQEDRFPPMPKGRSPAFGQDLSDRLSAACEILRLRHRLLPHPNSRRLPVAILPLLEAFAPQSLAATKAEERLFLANLQWSQRLRSLENRPLIVLTAASTLQGNNGSDAAQTAAKIWGELQAELAGLSTQSQHQIIPDSGHLLHFDQPDAIIVAVRRIVDQVQLPKDMGL